MSINHLVVSWIEIGGLVVGLYGFLFLSLGFLGKAGPRLLSPLVPATISGVASALVFFVGYHITTPILSKGSTFNPVVGALVVGGFNAVGLYSLLLDEDDDGIMSMIFRPKLIATGFLALALLEALTIAVVLLVGWPTFLIAFVSGIVVVSMFLGLSVFIALRMSREQLQRLGLMFSAVAILTQFLPPVLDVLGITVTTK